MHILSVVGARPNFVKIAPIAWEISKRNNIQHTIIHTGQHYDAVMSEGFFKMLDIPEPDINLGVGSDSHGIQTGKIMMEIEPVLHRIKPDWVITVGDVNSTAAASMVAVKLGIRTAHVEAGLRSGDRAMPEEINRIVTDSISDLLFVTENAGEQNLLNEGVDPAKIKFVGNVMIDSLVRTLPKAVALKAYEKFKIVPESYVLVTIHRPSNVDDRRQLSDLVDALISISRKSPVLFPVHPRTRQKLIEFSLMGDLRNNDRIIITEPLDYLTFLSLVVKARALITDSGGIQEETTYLHIPCMTIRPNTERPSTITIGTNELIKPNSKDILKAFERLENGNWREGEIPPLWDGKTAGRIVDVLLEN
ncbi:MAG: UDP-N-acetylglucosamine 2-epimerase (non-hydrolyzing) [Candidatus Electryonea clarkiae]|nr:UDP-N-acetylglucosamine 2-epimerase (non-hydrolyzing) [Candidatus Electryonea clarkiae]MDP8285873.1 UDP-N-acetylglucosamine 2-epimerase (non-hydrolyzing) [Candidatus Electryonea clarkiae]